MMAERIPQLLLVAGTGRNSGKTTLVCDVIHKVCQHHQVTAIKITPHFHERSISGEVLIDREGLLVMQEQQSTLDKDSSRMLKAGAQVVYFVMAREEKVGEAFQEILKLIPKNQPIVCESGELRHHVEPGLFLMMNRCDKAEFKPDTQTLKSMSDRWITFDGFTIDFDPETINFTENQWKIIPKN